MIPGYGDATKVAVVVGKFVVKHPHLAKLAVGLMAGVTKYSDETTEALTVLKASYGDEVLGVLRAHGATDSTLVQLYKRDVNLFRVGKMFENVCEGGWTPTKRLTASADGTPPTPPSSTRTATQTT